MISKSDVEFIQKKLMPWARLRKLFVAYSPSTARWPDIWISLNGVPKITVTDEWRRQGMHERRKRLTHEVLHVLGMEHDESIGYSTRPERDSYSRAIYKLLNPIPRPSPAREPAKYDKWKQMQLDAKDRISEWLTGRSKFGTSHQMSVREIISEGYKWRNWAHEHNSYWDWAVWLEIKKLAEKYGYNYKARLTKKELMDDPLLPDYKGSLGSNGDLETTNWRNAAVRSKFLKFLKSDKGKEWRIRSLREVWREVLLAPEDTLKEFYPGMVGLRKALSWKDALETEITIYRGLSAKSIEKRRVPFKSYTTSPQIAEKFSRGYLRSYDTGPGTGVIIQKKLKFKDLMGYLNPDGEYEVLSRNNPKGGNQMNHLTPDLKKLGKTADHTVIIRRSGE